MVMFCVISFVIGRVTKEAVKLPDTREVGMKCMVFGANGKHDLWSEPIAVDEAVRIWFHNAKEIYLSFSEVTEGELKAEYMRFIYKPDMVSWSPGMHKLEFKAEAKKKRFSQWVIAGWVQDPKTDEATVQVEDVLKHLPPTFDMNDMENCFLYVCDPKVGL